MNTIPDSIDAASIQRWWASVSNLPWKEVLGALDGPSEPWFSLCLFLATSGLMIQRLEAMENQGLEGTVLGTVIMPYCSGISNLIFAFVLGRAGGSGSLVLENCLVNNATNLTLLIGLPALLWHLDIYPGRSKKKKKAAVAAKYRINHLSLLLTLIAVMFFSGVTWALARDGSIDFGDGLVLVGVFLFWQIFHVFDVLKQNVLKKRGFSWQMAGNLLIILAAGYGVYVSVEQLVDWIPRDGSGLLVFDKLGWLSGFVMVLPNALLAFYYAAKDRADIVYSSQAGDGHICIPMCIGLFALFKTIPVPAFFDTGIVVITASGLTHFLFVAFFGRLPRFFALLLVCAYGFFLYKGFFAAFG